MEYNVFQNRSPLLAAQQLNEWRIYQFDELLIDDTKNAIKVKKEDYLYQGQYAIVDQGQTLVAGYRNDMNGLYRTTGSIIFGDHTRAIKYIDFPLFLGADGVKLLKCKLSESLVNMKYVYYFLKTIDLPSDGYSRHFKYLKQVFIPLPPIIQQQKIVDVLDKVQQLIDKRKEQIEACDELIKSQFIEMFGDLNQNNKGWREEKLEEACSVIHRYPTFYGMDYIQQGTPVIRIGNILVDGTVDHNLENYVYVCDTVNKDFPLTVIEKDDILMAVRGDGSAAKRIGLVKSEKLCGSNLSPNLLRIKAKEGVTNSIFLFWYLTSNVGQKRLDAYVNKTAKKNIAAKDIKIVVTPIPPIELQNQFAQFVQQVDKLKFGMEQSLIELENNFNALMQKAFKGELF